MQDILDYNKIVVPENVPQDINAEVFLDFFPQDTFRVKFCGLHKRNAYNDILDIEKEQDKFLLHLGRNSLYNSLPEYLFHCIDRFDNIPEREKNKDFQRNMLSRKEKKSKPISSFPRLTLYCFSYGWKLENN